MDGTKLTMVIVRSLSYNIILTTWSPNMGISFVVGLGKLSLSVKSLSVVVSNGIVIQPEPIGITKVGSSFNIHVLLLSVSISKS